LLLCNSFPPRRAPYANRTVDQAHDVSDDDLCDEPALCLIAARREEVFRVYEGLEAQLISGPPRLNPLYRLELDGETAVLYREFPSKDYEEEYQACKRYLPESVQMSASTLKALKAGRWNNALRELSEHYVILDLPERY
jgi:hypothetical protein